MTSARMRPIAARSGQLYAALADDISQYVQAHLDQDISIDSLATRAGVSKFHLNRLFEAVTGFQLGEFIQRRRLQRAYFLLVSGNSSILDVGLTAGYASHSAFSRAFLKAFGYRPSQVKANAVRKWQTPNTIKKPPPRDQRLRPELLALPTRQLRGLYGAGFDKNSFIALGQRLFDGLGGHLDAAGLAGAGMPVIGVSADSPWQGDPEQSRYFLGVDGSDLPERSGLATYEWQAGMWARFHHRGSYASMWQTISRIYAGWIIPEGIRLRDEAIVQVFLNNPKNTPAAERMTALHFPVLP